MVLTQLYLLSGKKQTLCVLPITDLRRVMQRSLRCLLDHRVGQRGMDGKQFQQLADMRFLARMHEHDHLRLRREALQGPDRDVQVRDIRAGVVVAPAVDEFPDEEIRRLLLQRPVKVAGRGETLGLDAELPVQRAEVGVEGGFDQGVERCHAGAAHAGSTDGADARNPSRTPSAQSATKPWIDSANSGSGRILSIVQWMITCSRASSSVTVHASAWGQSTSA